MGGTVGENKKKRAWSWSTVDMDFFYMSNEYLAYSTGLTNS